MVSRWFLAYAVVELAAVVALAWSIGLGWTILLLAALAVGIALAGSQVSNTGAIVANGPGTGAGIFDIVANQIASAVDLIVQTARLSDGSRKVVEIAEITGITK